MRTTFASLPDGALFRFVREIEDEQAGLTGAKLGLCRKVSPIGFDVLGYTNFPEKQPGTRVECILETIPVGLTDLAIALAVLDAHLTGRPVSETIRQAYPGYTVTRFIENGYWLADDEFSRVGIADPCGAIYPTATSSPAVKARFVKADGLRQAVERTARREWEQLQPAARRR